MPDLLSFFRLRVHPPALPFTPLRVRLERAYKRGYNDGYRAGKAAGTLRAWAWGLWR